MQLCTVSFIFYHFPESEAGDWEQLSGNYLSSSLHSVRALSVCCFWISCFTVVILRNFLKDYDLYELCWIQ